MGAPDKQLVNVPVLEGDSVLFGGESIDNLSDERIAELVGFWDVEIGEDGTSRDALIGFFENMRPSLEEGDNNIVRKAIVLEAELGKPLERYRNKELQNFLGLAGIEYETDANKKTLCALLRFGPLGSNENDFDDAPDAPEQTSEPEKPKMVSVFSHYEAVGNIKDNGSSYKQGDEYNGENADALLSSGALRAVYVEKREDEIPDRSDSE